MREHRQTTKPRIQDNKTFDTSEANIFLQQKNKRKDRLDKNKEHRKKRGWDDDYECLVDLDDPT